MSSPTVERSRPPRAQPPHPPVSIDESKLFRQPPGSPPPDRRSFERRSSGEGAQTPRRQPSNEPVVKRSKDGYNSNGNSHRTMSTDPNQTLTARHIGSISQAELNRQTTSNGSTMAKDVEKNAADLPREEKARIFLQRARGKHLKHIPTIRESLIATLKQSWLNVLFVFVPLSWISHFLHWPDKVTFALSFMALIPLESILQFGGMQMMAYLGVRLGNLLIVTLCNIVEAILAIVLLANCKVRLVQSTVIGVVLLQLLFVTGVGFLTGGTRAIEQELHSTATQLNHTLLAMGVLATLIPAVMLSAGEKISATSIDKVMNDTIRADFLALSRGMAIILLFVYVASRWYLYNPPGEDNAFQLDDKAPKALHEEEEKWRNHQPDVGPGFCMIMLIVAVAFVAATAEWLVHATHFVAKSGISEEWFGLILLPLVSFSGDGLISFSYLFRHAFFNRGHTPHTLADAKPIDLAIQFALFWIPLLVLLAWILGKPLSMLFDMFEVVMLLGACFLINYITADSKTNWAEGYTLISFYVIIALVAWFYDGQEAIQEMVKCTALNLVSGNDTTSSESSTSEGGH